VFSFTLDRIKFPFRILRPIERKAVPHKPVNLKTAKALGLEIPPGMIMGADALLE
jgi:hypothetical protein